MTFSGKITWADMVPPKLTAQDIKEQIVRAGRASPHMYLVDAYKELEWGGLLKQIK